MRLTLKLSKLRFSFACQNPLGSVRENLVGGWEAEGGRRSLLLPACLALSDGIAPAMAFTLASSSWCHIPEFTTLSEAASSSPQAQQQPVVLPAQRS